MSRIMTKMGSLNQRQKGTVLCLITFLFMGFFLERMHRVINALLSDASEDLTQAILHELSQGKTAHE